jgi:GntR family transcriptional regulator, transcriptional repressor for pyruvate dehydrogenase complex
MEAIRTPASYELVVDQIRRAIRTGRFVVGQKLPPERELARQLGVSRTTVREALRVLQGEGLVETRRGRSGGPVVLGDAMSPAAMRRMVRNRLAEIDDIYDFRGVVEAATARLAAQRRTEREAAHLRETVETMTALVEAGGEGDDDAPPSRFFAVDHDLHLSIAQAARNPMLRKAVEDVRAAMFMPVGAIFTRLHPSANTFHEEIVEAIQRKDPDAAAQAMLDHIEGTRAALREFAVGAAGTDKGGSSPGSARRRRRQTSSK